MGVKDSGKGLVRKAGTDIASRLRASEERLKLAMDASQTGIWEWDVASGRLTWSNQLKKIYGLHPDTKVTYELYMSYVHPEDRPEKERIIKKSMRDGSSYSIEHRVIWPDKSVHWVLGQGKAYLENGKPVRMVGTSILIDERKTAELKLQESEERFRNMADTAPVLIWLADTENLGTYFNKPWLDFTGRTLEQELGLGWAESVHPDDLPRAASYCQKCFDARKEFRMEFRLRRADGQYRWMVDHGIPRYDADGVFMGYIGSCVEIEEIKSTRKRTSELEEINRRLKAQQEELVEINRTKDEFISLASHQLRTPATGVKQYIGMLLEGYGDKLNPNQVRMLKTAYESNERQLNIIDDLLKVAHIDAGKVSLRKQKIDLVWLLQDTIDEQADTFRRKNQQITFKHTAKSMTAYIDAERMRMVLENLIDNASKYTPEGKKITVILDKSARDITISVKDEGVGIAKRDIPRLFQKFSRINNTLSASVGGTGLGLYWAHKIVLLHNGSISVQSTVRKGSTFTITIPRGRHEKDSHR